MKKISRKSSLANAKKKAWIAFSKYIRSRDKTCVTCPTGRAENAGHFWHGLLDFDEININGQCVRCNKWLSGNLAVYSTYLINKYGTKAFKKLEERKFKAKSGEIRSIDDYQKIEQKYIRKLSTVDL